MPQTALIDQPTPRTARKVQAAAGGAAVASAAGPALVAWAFSAATGADLSAGCAGELSQGLMAALVGGGGMLGGLAAWASGYFARERAEG